MWKISQFSILNSQFHSLSPLHSSIASRPVSTGTRFGAYEVIAPIGAGGMGEVYRARDTRLDRSVAIKVLPSEYDWKLFCLLW